MLSWWQRDPALLAVLAQRRRAMLRGRDRGAERLAVLDEASGRERALMSGAATWRLGRRPSPAGGGIVSLRRGWYSGAPKRRCAPPATRLSACATRSRGTVTHRPPGQPAEPPRPRPLTRRNADGQVYRRLPEVEAQLVAALRLEPRQLLERAATSDPAAPGYLCEEALVYLLREAHGLGERETATALAEALVRRATPTIRARLRALGRGRLEEACADVVEELFVRILDLDSDRGDFLQVRFGVVLKRLCIDVFGRYVHQPREQPLAVGEPGEDEDDPLELAEPSLPLDERVLLQEALARLDEPYRSAFVLRYYEDWPVEDRDPSVPTLSRHFGVTPRTIRNWLRRAHETLQRWRGEEG